MSTNRPNTSAGTPAAGRPWGRGAKVFVSLLLIWHLVAMLTGPLSVPRSVFGSALQVVFRPYLHATYLDHAYKFFAPDPGPSHLIRYDVELADGSHKQGEFPRRSEIWPRLLYHRYFMLSEFMGNVEPAPGWETQTWEQQKPFQAEYVRAYATHLLSQYDGRRVTLELVQHGIPSPPEVEGGMRLTDPRLYRTRPLGSFAAGEQP